MIPRIRFTASAEADLLELRLTIAEENLPTADESLDSIQSTVAQLGRQPEMGDATALSCAHTFHLGRTRME